MISCCNFGWIRERFEQKRFWFFRVVASGKSAYLQCSQPKGGGVWVRVRLSLLNRTFD